MICFVKAMYKFFFDYFEYDEKNIVDFFCYMTCKKRLFRLYLYSSIVQC